MYWMCFNEQLLICAAEVDIIKLLPAIFLYTKVLFNTSKKKHGLKKKSISLSTLVRVKNVDIFCKLGALVSSSLP